MDYGPKNISVGTDLRTDEDVKLSLTGLWFRINDKIERLKQLVVFGKSAQNEPMIDAFSDLSVYGIIAQIVHRKKWSKQMNMTHLIGWSCIGLCWWVFAFTMGFFQTIMWTVILLAVIGIYIQLNENK